jgi:RNA polymerase sigma factor (sigma-70 family)
VLATARRAETAPLGDADLVAAARVGDQRAFGELVARHQGVVCSFAYAMIGDAAASEEIAHEAFVIAWRRLAEMKQPQRFRGWVCGVARKLTQQWRRGGRARHALAPVSLSEATQIRSPEPSPLDRMIGAEERRLVALALDALPEAYRIPIVLTTREQVSIGEVAETLDLTEETVRQRLTRGRRLLQQRLDERVTLALRRTRPTQAFTAAVIAAIAMPRAARAATPAPSMTVAVTLLGTALVVGTAASTVLALRLHGRADRTTGPASRAPVAAPPLPRWTEAERATALSGQPPALAPAERVLVRFDFEDDAMPPDMVEGDVVKGPEGRSCLLGSIVTRWNSPELAMVYKPGAHTPIRFSDSVVIKFDYWVGGSDEDAIQVMVRTQDVPASRELWFHSYRVRPIAHGAWTHAEVRLADVRPQVAGDPLPHEGQYVTQLALVAGLLGREPFYVDNVEVVSRNPSPRQ